jgi:hypothetical protein
MRHQPRLHQRPSHHLLGVGLLAIAGIVTTLLVISLIGGRLTTAAILVNLIIIAGTLLVGIIFLRGDEIGGATVDEGQRGAQIRAQSLAFYIAYFGLFALFLEAGFFPQALSAAWMAPALGLLLLVLIVVWFGGYMWYRWWA